MKNKKSGQATPKGGQATLLALFVMSVIVTVGMALISRTITDIEISETGEQGIRAFSAAEAGVEKAFVTAWDDLAGLSEDIGLEGFTGKIKLTPKHEIERPLKQGEVVFVKLDGANPLIEEVSGVELILYDGNDGYEKRAYGGCVANPTGVLEDINFNGAQNASVRILCGDADNFRISGGGLPAQEYDIESKASALEGKTGAIEASRTVPGYPPMFDYVLFSGGSLGGE